MAGNNRGEMDEKTQKGQKTHSKVVSNAVALMCKYKHSWLTSTVKENDIDSVVRLLELGIRPTDDDESLVDDALTAGNFEMAALLRKHGAPLNFQATHLLSHWKKWKGADAARLALWEYVECKKESDLVTVRPLRKWAILRHWVRPIAVVSYWRHLAAMPESKGAESAAKRFKASVEGAA